MTTDEARAQLKDAIEGVGAKNYRRVMDEMFSRPQSHGIGDEAEVIELLRAIVTQLREQIAIRELLRVTEEKNFQTQASIARTWQARYEALAAAVKAK